MKKTNNKLDVSKLESREYTVMNFDATFRLV